jgi:hypothetical protein
LNEQHYVLLNKDIILFFNEKIPLNFGWVSENKINIEM